MQISDEVIKVFDYLAEKLGVTIDWTNQNVVPYIEQLFDKFIQWELTTSIAYIVMFSIFILALSIALIAIVKKWGWREDNVIIIAGIVTAAIICLSVAIVVQVFDVITCNTFPEKALFDFIQFYGLC